MNLIQLRRTCYASPSQWEGITEDGRHIYIRYRWGRLMMGLGQTPDQAVSNAGNLLHTQIGDDFDGYMATEDMLSHTKLTCAGGYDEDPIVRDQDIFQ